MPAYLGDLKNVSPAAPADLTPYTKAWTPKEIADTEAVKTDTEEQQIKMARKQKYIETYKTLDPNMDPQQKYQTLAAIDPDEANKFMEFTATDHLNRVKQKQAEVDAHTAVIGNMIEGWQQRNPDPTTPQAKLEYEQIENYAKNSPFGSKGMPPSAEYDFYGKNMGPILQNFRDRTLTVKDAIAAKITEAETRGDMPPTAEGKVVPTEPKAARLEQNKIDWYKATHPNTYGANAMTPEQVDAVNEAMNNGYPPDMVNSRTAPVIAKLQLAQPGRSWTREMAESKFQRMNTTMTSKALLNTIEPMISNLLEKGKALGNTRFPGINRVKNFIAEETGDPKIVSFNNARDALVAEIEKALTGNVVTDTKYIREINNIKSAASYKQLQAAMGSTRANLASRNEALTAGPNVDKFNPTESETRPSFVRDPKTNKLVRKK